MTIMNSSSELLVSSGLAARDVSQWSEATPVAADFDADIARFTHYWSLTSHLIDMLPNKPQRSSSEQSAAETLLTAGRTSRESFLSVHAKRLYEQLTMRRSRFLRVEQLVAAAADAYPGLVPSEPQLAAEANTRQADKDGLEIDQGLFLAHVLADRDCGMHLCHAMLLPKPESQNLLEELHSTSSLDLGTVRLERKERVLHLTTSNRRFLNAEDHTTLDNMELAVDVATLDPLSDVVVIRGDRIGSGKYRDRVFGAGINLTHLYQGKIPFLWFITRELGFMNKIMRGVASVEILPDDLHGGSIEKPWVAAVDEFAIGGHCQLLLCTDYILADSNARLTLPARKEGIIPGAANLRLPRFTGMRLARQAIQYGLELPCDSTNGRMICDEIVYADQMDPAIDRICRSILQSGRTGMIANRRAFRIGQEPFDGFRQYCAAYAREQAYCHFSADLIFNLEQHWKAKERVA
jgi:(3,5-dihydroxyphenyl)acetyl-CoA 1,2-dioxygenase